MPIILVCTSIILFIISLFLNAHTYKINKEVDIENQRLQNEYQKINKDIDIVKKEFFKENQNYRDIKQEVSVAQRELIDTKNHLNDIQNNLSKTIDNQKELSQQAFKNYCEILDKQYEEAENEYDMYKDAMKTAYSNLQLELIKKTEAAKEELAQIEATRAAAIQAQIKEKEIEEQQSFYCLQIKDNDLKDVSVLESIKPKLNTPRILSMLIWQTYFRTPMTNLCNNIIGKDTKTGIYKITNQQTKECYIGQAVDLATRWKNHAKCGLGIDTPAGNKLYKAMQDYGIWNFSWEILELCSKDQLDEKEQYYIKLYQAKEYGYNSKKI